MKRITKSERQFAFDAGCQDFNDGLKCFPSCSKKLKQVWINTDVGMSLQYFKQWCRGWHFESLKPSREELIRRIYIKTDNDIGYEILYDLEASELMDMYYKYCIFN